MKRQATISSYFTKKQKLEPKPSTDQTTSEIPQTPPKRKSSDSSTLHTFKSKSTESPTPQESKPSPKRIKTSNEPLTPQEIESLSNRFKAKLGDLSQSRSEKRQIADQVESDLLQNKQLNTKNLTPLESQVVALKAKYPDCLLLIEVGYKFRFFGQDAKIASKVLHIANFVDRHFYVASIPVHRLDVHVQKLVHAGYKVGIVRQTESAALKTDKGQPFQRELTQLVTKGTNIDTMVSTQKHTASTLLCIVEEKRGGHASDERVEIGMVSIQTSTGDIIYDAFEDTFMRHELETRLLHIEPNEVLLSEEPSRPTEKLIQHSACFDQDTVRIERFRNHDYHLNYNSALTFVTDFYSKNNAQSLTQVLELPPIIIKALACLISYLDEFKLSNILQLTQFYTHFVSAKHMLLNGNTLVNLEIFRNNTDFSEKGSLFSVLNHTTTPFGKRLLKKWIGRPLVALDALNARIDAVEELIHTTNTTKTQVVTLLRQLPDIEKGLARVHYGKSSPVELVQVLNAFYKTSTITVSEPFKSPLLSSLVDNLPTIEQDIQAFRSAIRLDYQTSDRLDTFFQSEEQWPEIPKEKKNIQYIETQLDEHLHALKASSSIQTIEYVTVAGIEYLVQVSNKDVKKVPMDWIKISGTKAVSRFHDKRIIQLLKDRERHKELLFLATQGAYQTFLAQVAEKYTILRHVVSCLAQLDCLLSLCITSQQVNYVKPVFGDEIRVVGGRHPMIEQTREYVPNDIEFTTRTMVLTGPNMGGKSSYIRQVALISMMGQIGCYVPATEAQLKVLDAVYTRMGASDHMMRGESTFMVELNETSEIIKHATDRSLVILDELGRGTSTHDGQAIAYAVLTHFVERVKSLTLFVTHYPVLGQVPNTRNCHMSYMVDKEEDQVVFLYKLVDGIAMHSFGMNVARLANIPSSIVQKAKETANQLQRKQVEYKLVQHVLQSDTVDVSLLRESIKKIT